SFLTCRRRRLQTKSVLVASVTSAESVVSSKNSQTSCVRDPKTLRSTSVNGQYDNSIRRNQRRPKQRKPNQPKEQKMKLKTQIAVIVLALGVSTSLVSSQDSQPRQLRTATPTIVGVWQLVRHGVDCQTGEDLPISFPAIVTFHSDGTMTGDTGGTDTTEHGLGTRGTS